MPHAQKQTGKVILHDVAKGKAHGSAPPATTPQTLRSKRLISIHKPPIVNAMRWLATVVALWLCGLPGVSAQSQDWLVLPTTTEAGAAWMQPTVDQIGRELRRQGVGVWMPDRAVVAFEARGSRPVAEISDREIAARAAQSEGALRLLALGEHAAALAELRDVQAHFGRALETVNRDPAGAQIVLDTCLYLLRALIETGDEPSATAQAKRCVQMVPSGEPSDRMHPPMVLDRYEAARAPGPGHTSALLVESQPSECPLRVNGVLLGETPLEVPDLYPGEYRVQVECQPGAPGRVHTVEVPRGNTSLFVFDYLDRAVRSDPVLHLLYEEPTDTQQLVRDGRYVARALPAAAVVVGSTDGDQTLQLRVVTATLVDPILVRIPVTDAGPNPSVVANAVTALLKGECVDFTESEPVPIDCATGAPTKPVASPVTSRAPRTRRRPPRAQFISGVALASVGTASMLTGYSLVISRRSAGDDWINDPNSIGTQDKWLRLGTGVIATSSAGAGLLVAAMPLALPYRRKTPWWAWLSGGLGLAAAAGAITSVVTADAKPPQSCSINGPDPTPCVDRYRDTDRALVLGMTAAPLLTMPLVYLLRRSDKGLSTDLLPVLVAGRGRGVLGVRGVF